MDAGQPNFNPGEHLMKIRGKNGMTDYMQVQWRIVWLRHEHPNAIIDTEKIAGGMEANYAEFKATVSIPGGGSATGYGSETKADFGDFIEKAETKALGRAIAALGYGTQFVGNELDEGERIVDSPIPVPAQPPRRDTANPPPAFVNRPREEVAAGADNDLPVIRDAFAAPDLRKFTLHKYYLGATTLAELNQRADAAYGSGMDTEVLKAAYKHHHDRLSRQFAPAGIAG